jgi:hypothetical protein
MWRSVVVHEHWPVSQRIIVARFDWSHDHLGWTIRTWRRAHWSAESRFLLRPIDGSSIWGQLRYYLRRIVESRGVPGKTREIQGKRGKLYPFHFRFPVHDFL